MDGVMFMHSPRLPPFAVSWTMPSASDRCIASNPRSASRVTRRTLHANIRVQRRLSPRVVWAISAGIACESRFAMPRGIAGAGHGANSRHAADGVTPTQFSGELIFATVAAAGFIVHS
jgi:hypothetical protein